jgi:hypothetical protein
MGRIFFSVGVKNPAPPAQKNLCAPCSTAAPFKDRCAAAKGTGSATPQRTSPLAAQREAELEK